MVVPARITVGVTVVPRAGSASAETTRAWWASSRVALTPSSGSSPACAARPSTRTSYSETPLRAVFSAPPSAEASSTRATDASRASSSMRAREVGEPISSSPVTSRVTPSRSSRSARAWKAIARPAFMSKQPGPRTTPPSADHGCVSNDPSGQTVSWWPSTSTREGPVPSRQRRWVRPSTTTYSGATPRRAEPIRATTSAERPTAARSDDGDSHSTSSRRSLRTRDRSISRPAVWHGRRSARSARRSAARRRSPAPTSLPPAASPRTAPGPPRPGGTPRRGRAPSRRAVR